MKHPYLDRPTTAAIKGIALIIMFVHHFFTFQSWLVTGIEYAWMEKFTELYCRTTQICVPVFAFLMGYFYFTARKKTFAYSVRKISDVLVSYWIIYVPLWAMAIALGCHVFSYKDILHELFGLYNSVMCFCWYIYFYSIVMLLLPVLTRPLNRGFWADAVMLLVLPAMVLEYWVHQEGLHWLLETVLYNFVNWLPCIFSGYLFAKYDGFSRIFGTRMEGLSGWKRIAALVLIAWLGFRGRHILQDVRLGYLTILGGRYKLALPMDIVYAPMFIYGFGNLLQFVKTKLPFTLLEKIGEKSMLMWFLHCMFFNVCKEYTQPILYFPQNPVLVLLNGLLICYVLACLVNPVLKWLLKIKNRILDFVFFWEK